MTGGFHGGLNHAYDLPPLKARASELSGSDYQNGILSDTITHMLPWKKVVSEHLLSGRAPLLNMDNGAGELLLGAAQAAPFDPLTLPFLILPLPLAWTLSISLKFFLAALLTCLFLRDLGTSEPLAFFGAAAYTLSTFLLFWSGWPHGTVFAIFPLMLIGLRRLARSERHGFGPTLGGFTWALLAGHPESLLHTVAAAGVFFAFELVASPKRTRAIAQATGAGLLALGLSAPALLPLLDALPQTWDHGHRQRTYVNLKKSLPLDGVAHAALGAFFPNTYGKLWAGERPTPLLFDEATFACVGGTVFAFAMLGAFSKRREARCLCVLAVLSFGVAVGVPGFADTVPKLPLFDMAINGRLTGVTAFCLALLAALGLEILTERRGRREVVALAGAIVFLLGIGIASRKVLLGQGLSSQRFDLILLFTIGSPTALVVMATFRRIQPRILGGAATALTLASPFAVLPNLYHTFPARLFYPEFEELRALPKGGEPYRTVGLSYALIPDQSVYYGLEDPRRCAVMTNQRYHDTLVLWSDPSSWFGKVDDATNATRPFLSLLNVRYGIADPNAKPPKGWTEVTRGRNCAIFQNPSALPRAFAPKRVRLRPDATRNIGEIKSCVDFAEIAWIERPGQPEIEVGNGKASVTSKADGQDLILTIDAERPAWIVVSQTAWRGWKAIEGAREYPIHFANHAFLGFEVPAGRHVVKVMFRPASWTIGLAVGAIAGLVVVAVWLSAPKTPSFVKRGQGELESAG